MELTILMLVHNSAQCAEHIEKHIGAVNELVDKILGNATATDKLKAIHDLKVEFDIIKSDAERALASFVDV